MRLKCTRPDVRNTARGALVGLQLMSGAGPAAAFVAPAAIVAGLVGAAGIGAALGRATAGPHANVCDYGPARGGPLELTLAPVGE